MAKFTITREAARELLVATGLLAAPNYTDTRLLQRIREYNSLTDDQRSEVQEPRLIKLQNQVMLANTRADIVVLKDDEPAETPKKGRASTAVEEKADSDEEKNEKPKKKKRPKYDDDDNPKKKPKPPEYKPAPPTMPQERDMTQVRKLERAAAGTGRKRRAKPKRGVGIKDVCLDSLAKASKKRPVTRGMIQGVVIDKYPERDAAALRATVKYYVPGYLRRMGYDVKQNDNGFWLED